MEIRKESEAREEAQSYTAPKLVFEGDLSDITKTKVGQVSV